MCLPDLQLQEARSEDERMQLMTEWDAFATVASLMLVPALALVGLLTVGVLVVRGIISLIRRVL